VHVAKGLTQAQAKAYRIADNQTARLSEWDYDRLPIELSELQEMDFPLDLVGFSPDELQKLLGTEESRLRAGTAGRSDHAAGPIVGTRKAPLVVWRFEQG
jgi:hypothetical protein